MPDAIREQIMKKVLAKLQTITVANGYANTFQSSAVQRLKETGQVTATTPFIIIIEGDEDVDGQVSSGTVTLIEKQLQVHLVIGSKLAASSSTPMDEHMNSLCADVEKAMLSNYHWDSLAKDTDKVSETETAIEDGQPRMARSQTYEIRYRHNRADPTSIT